MHLLPGTQTPARVIPPTQYSESGNRFGVHLCILRRDCFRRSPAGSAVLGLLCGLNCLPTYASELYFCLKCSLPQLGLFANLDLHSSNLRVCAASLHFFPTILQTSRQMLPPDLGIPASLCQSCAHAADQRAHAFTEIDLVSGKPGL